MYWLNVYLLVAIGVAVPFLLLYIVGLLFWLIRAAIGSTIHGLKNVFAVGPGFWSGHWSVIWRKAA